MLCFFFFAKLASVFSLVLHLRLRGGRFVLTAGATREGMGSVLNVSFGTVTYGVNAKFNFWASAPASYSLTHLKSHWKT